MRIKKIIIVLFFISVNIRCFAQSYSNLYNHTNSPIDESKLYSLAMDSSQVVWLGSFSHVYRFINDNWQDIKPDIFSDTSGFYYIKDIQVSNIGEVWLTNPKFSGNDNISLIKYSVGKWTTYKASASVYDATKLFIDNNNKPWFVLTNWWPHQWGIDKIGTLEDDTLRIIDLPWDAFQFGDIIKIEDTLYVTRYGSSQGVLKVFNDEWKIIETTDWDPIHIWKDMNYSILGGQKLCKLNGTKFYYYANVDSFLQEHNANVNSFARENQNTFWIGTDNGYLLKIESENVNLIQKPGSNAISNLIIDRNKNKWMIIDSIGVYEYNENGIVNVEKRISKRSTNFKLYDNYPNPFNPSTTISFNIPVASKINLEIYNVLGKQIKTLINKEMNPGNYKINFNAENLPSGIYFYKLISGPYTETKKMILLK